MPAYGAVQDRTDVVRAGEETMKASDLSFRGAVVLAAAGMAWGLHMAISQDHQAMPAHAHLNLLGWVSLFLFGVFYQLHPAIDRSRVALAQVAIWIVATVVLATGLGVMLVGGSPEIGEPIAAISSIVAFLDMLLFGWLVFRRDRVAA
jgi:hypothetical protein